MNIIDYLIPSIYLFVSIIAGKFNKLYYLIFPLAIYQGAGAFINPKSGIIFLTGSYRINDFLAVYMLIISFGISSISLKEIVVKQKILFMFFLFFLIVGILSFSARNSMSDIILSSRILFYPFLFFIISVKLLSCVSVYELFRFLDKLIIITIVSSLLYFFNSSGLLKIFPYELASDKIIMDTNVNRDYATLPIMLQFMFCFCIVQFFEKERIISKGMITLLFLVLCLATFFSYTRALFFISLLLLILSFLIYSFNIKSILKSSLKVLLITMFLILIYFCTSIFFKIEQLYFLDRLSEFFIGGYYNTPNLILRFNYFLIPANRLLQSGDLILGLGFQNFQNLNELFVGFPDWETDTMYGWIIASTGLIGCIFAFWVFCSNIFINFKYYIKYLHWIYLWIGLTVTYFFLFSFTSNILLRPLLVALPFAIYFITRYHLWRVEN